MIPNIPIPVVATPIARSNPSSVGPAICGYAVTIIPKPRIPMPLARSNIQLVFNSRVCCCIIVGHMLYYYAKLVYNGFNVSCKNYQMKRMIVAGLWDGRNKKDGIRNASAKMYIPSPMRIKGRAMVPIRLTLDATRG